MKIIKENLKEIKIKFFYFKDKSNDEDILVVEETLNEKEVNKIWEYIKGKMDMQLK